LRAAGIDVGRRVDRTAMAVLDDLRLVDVLVLSGVPFARQYQLLGDRLRHHGPHAVAVDSTGMGGPVAEQLEGQGWPVVPVSIGGAGAASHFELFSRLRWVINSGHFSVAKDCPWRGLMRDELKALRGSLTPVRARLRVEAAAGHHDDLAFALALAVLARDRARGRDVLDDLR
jgi:hypothetical protein